MGLRIKDLLLVTLLAALAAVGFRGYQQVRTTRVELAQLRTDTEVKQTEIRRLQFQLELAPARLDFYEQVAQAYAPARQAFDDLQLRYGIVEPRPDLASIRTVPEIRESLSASPTRYRISVSDKFPVYLRTAVGVASDNKRIASQQLDQNDWLEGPPVSESPVSESRRLQTQLSAGIHDLTITIFRTHYPIASSRIELVLDGKLLIQTKTMAQEQSIGSWSSTSFYGQHDFDFQNGTMYLMEIDIDNEQRQADYQYWIWLSVEKDVAGFREFPLGESAQ